jgi:ATP-dependent Clp protease ATP-binding subunit ClpC
MRLELQDLYTGIIWYNHLHGLVKSARERRRDGGIARDLNFGYIPTLQRFGWNLSTQHKGKLKTQVHLATHRDIVAKIISAFSHDGKQNIALIGPEGSGRSTIVQAFASEIMDADAKVANNLKYRQVFMLDAAALISAASGPGQLEGLIMRIFNEAYAAKNIIIFLDNAQLFFEEGTGSVDVSKVLLPILEAGRLRVILTMDEQKFLEISTKNSTLANALNKIMVPPANREETMKVLQDKVPMLEQKYHVVCTYWALQEAYRLSEKYIHNIEMPGRAFRLLETACNYAEQQFVTAESVGRAIENTQGIRVQTTTDVEDRAMLLQLEDLIHQRMVNQSEAVKAVSDALRRAAAGVRNENRPIGTFLFLGPTGVGKTELAKALSEVYFHGEDQIVRIDLNEYVTADDVLRLIAEGTENSESLTAQVMKRPFSVVLLDEIEKAHPQVLTTLLQMLDEGILRDTKNHEVSFRDTIVIATSNAGANQIRNYVAEGQKLEVVKDELINALITEGHFKPEFLNRFDEICVFTPLSKTDLMRVVDLMIASVNKTLAPQKISVNLTDEAKQILIERGYDPQMGARPMRRIVQKTVENLVAKFILSGQISSGATITITKDML